MPDFKVSSLLDTGTVAARHVDSAGTCRAPGAEECASATHLVFPWRGTYLRHVGREQVVADANRVLLFNAGEGYRVSHPVAGGDASLVLIPSAPVLRELAPASSLKNRDVPAFHRQSLRLDARAQLLAALLRRRLQNGGMEPLEAENLLLALARHSLGGHGARETGGTRAKRRLVNRVKLLLASDLRRRWTLAEIGAGIGASPVYLTQVFRQVEGLPLYQYQLRLRLARALDLVTAGEDLATVAFELGFSSHSHFSAAFRRLYGCPPSTLGRALTRAANR